MSKGFLLCAGRGSRFQPQLQSFPKVLVPVLGVPLVSYNIYLLKKLGVQQIAVNTHIEPEKLQKTVIKSASRLDMLSPTFRHEETSLGTVRSLFKLKSFLADEEYFFYLNGDSFIYPRNFKTLENLLTSHKESKALATFLVRPSKNIKEVLWADKKGNICFFSKTTTLKDKNLRAYDFSGLAVFSSQIFNFIKPTDFHIFTDVLAPLRGESRIYSVSNLELLDMNQQDTYLEGCKKALQFLKEDRAPNFLTEVLQAFKAR